MDSGSRKCSSQAYWALAVVAFTAGAMILVFLIFAKTVVVGFAMTNRWFSACGAVLVVLGLWSAWQAHLREVLEAKETCEKDAPSSCDDVSRFARSRIGLGYSLLLMGLLNMTAFAGLAQSELLPQVFPKKGAFAAGNPIDSNKDQKQPSIKISWIKAKAIQLVISTGMACFGALFFLYNELYKLEKKAREGEEGNNYIKYDIRAFWAGTWFRLGEAVLFTVLFFLAFYTHMLPVTENLGPYSLPFIALFLGMFVKSAEKMVQGMSERVLGMIDALVTGPPPKKPSQDGK